METNLIPVIQEIIDTLIGEGVVIGDVASTEYFTGSYGKTGNVRFNVIFRLNPYNITGKVDMDNTDDNTNTVLTLKSEHLESGKNHILFAKRVASMCEVLSKGVAYTCK